MIKKFSDFNLKVYHGSDGKHNFNNRGYVWNGSFFSTSISEASHYGKFVYEVNLKQNLILFDCNEISDLEKLFQNFSEIYDDYFDEGEDGYVIKNARQLYNHSDSWNPIERTNGVLDWVQSVYDGVWIYEGGVRNLLLFDPVFSKIESFKLIPYP